MMNEIYERGPIVCSISTPEDFTYGYRAGIWPDDKKTTVEEIDHNVEVRGCLEALTGPALCIAACSTLGRLYADVLGECLKNVAYDSGWVEVVEFCTCGSNPNCVCY